jgi:hypothetical protein
MKVAVFWNVAPCSLVTDVSEVLAASIIRAMMEAASPDNGGNKQL